MEIMLVMLFYFCDIPVFQYALDFWSPGQYEVTVFYQGAPGEKDAITLLEEAEAHANFLLRKKVVNAAPCMEVRLPSQQMVYKTALTKNEAEKLLDSPARQRISHLILNGTSVAWVYIRSGDHTAGDLLLPFLKELEKNFPLSDQVSLDPRELSFSCVEVDPEDPKEAAFIQMLLGTEEDLPQYLGKEPMAFPVFGRGRALYGLVGKGITRENVLEACQYLTGPCSCLVKELNPGMDLLMRADWDGDFLSHEKEEASPINPGVKGLFFTLLAIILINAVFVIYVIKRVRKR